MLASAIWMLMYPYLKEHKLKRPRKKILFKIKKFLAVTRGKDITIERYNKLVTESSDVYMRAGDRMTLDSTNGRKLKMIDPSSMLMYFDKLVPELTTAFGLDQKDKDDLFNGYKSNGLGFTSLMFCNRVIGEMDIYFRKGNV